MELFIELDELDECLLKKAVSFVRQRLESAEGGAVEVEFIEITDGPDEGDSNAVVAATQSTESTVGACVVAAETESTEPTVGAPDAAPVPSPLMARGTTPTHADLIPIKRDCFNASKRYGPRSKDAAERAQSRAVKNIVDAVLDDSNTLEQQVYALRRAVKHRRMKLVSASSGLVMSNTKDIDQLIVTNIRDTLEIIRKTESACGKTCDDKRSLVRCSVSRLPIV